MAKLLTTRQLQEILKVDRTTIYRMIEQGRLSAVKVGGQWRFPADQVDGWLERDAASTASLPVLPAAGSTDGVTALMPLDCVQLIQDAFAEVLGVMLVVTDLDGRPITQVSNPSPLYHLLAKTETGFAVCHEKWRELGRVPALEPRFAPGFGGLLCARALVRIGNELKAMVVAFGIAPEEWPPDAELTAQLAESLAVPTAELRRALESAAVLPPGEQKRVLVTIQRIADILAHIGNERAALRARLATIANLCAL